MINLPKRVDLLENILQKQTGMKIKIINPNIKMGFVPSLTFTADEFKILNDDNSNALDIKNSEINIRVLPLIIKRIDIHKLNADRIDINLIYDGDFKLGQYKIPELQNKNDLTLYHLASHIEDYNISMHDKFSDKYILLDGQYLYIDDFRYNSHIKLSTASEINSNNKKALFQTDLDLKLPVQKISNTKINLSGQISNLDLADYSTYIEKLSKGKVKSSQGIINIVARTKKTIDKHNKINILGEIKNIKLEQEEGSIHSKDKITINADLTTINNGININNFNVSSPNINMYLQGGIAKLNSNNPYLNLKLSIPKARAEDVIDLLPAEHDISPDIDFALLKQAGFWGDASAYLDLKGKLFFPSIQGNVLVDNAYMVREIPNSAKATIKLLFNGDKFDLDVKVPTSPSQTVWVKGQIEDIYNSKSADLHITSTSNVDLKTAQIVLNPLHKILTFDIGPVPIMDIYGKGGINLTVKGTKTNPHAWGEFYFNNATVSFLDIHNMLIEKGSGSLKFDNQNTFFKSNSAYLNKKPISIQGTCTLLGVLNFDVIANSQDLGKLLTIIQTSPMLSNIQQLVSPIEFASNLSNFKLNLTGQVKDVSDIVFNKNLFAKGTVELLSNDIKLKGIPVQVSNITGNIDFDNLNAKFNLKSALRNSKINIVGSIKNNIGNIKVVSSKLNVGDLFNIAGINIPYQNDLATINSGFTAKYNGKIDNIEYDKINVKGKIYSNKGAKSAIIIANTDFELNNSNLKIPSLKGEFNSKPYNLSLNISKLFSKNRVINGIGKLSALNLNFLNDRNIKKYLPKELQNIDFGNGCIDISARAKNSNINLFTVFDNVEFTYIPQNVKVLIKSGNALIQNSNLNLNKVSANVDNMPLFLEGRIQNIYKNPNLNLYLNIKPNQEFFDKFFNTKSIYPIKLKGDVILTSKISGYTNNLNTKSTVDINENSSLYYMGATIGEVMHPVKLTLNSTYSPNRIKINDFQYDKIIYSQNNKPFVNTQLNLSGTLNILKNKNLGFNNFKIRTKNPTDARIFNIVFGKPFMKQGVFTSDLLLNGTTFYPEIIGTLDITSIDAPILDSTVRDINLNFRNDKIFIASKGTVLTNDIILDAVVKNRLRPPYIIENVKLSMADLDLNKIIDTINDMEAESARKVTVKQEGEPFDITQLVIQKGEVSANKIKVKNINADNFEAHLQLNDKHIFKANKFKFDIAEGLVTGKFSQNLKNHNVKLDIQLHKANAAIMAEALFELKGQIFGSLDGNFNLTCNTKKDCIETLSGEGNFKVANGRMPKLGSLEYLLKAGNLIKGGITELSLNGIFDLVTPLKTGDFESIYGDIHLTKGIADNINVYSSGKELNMYMNGKYNLVNSIANMKLYGSISKHVDSALSKVKNASLYTLFSTIPGISDSKENLLMQDDVAKIPNIKSADIFRIFTVDINGDINGNDYVRSFKWVK